MKKECPYEEVINDQELLPLITFLKTYLNVDFNDIPMEELTKLTNYINSDEENIYRFQGLALLFNTDKKIVNLMSNIHQYLYNLTTYKHIHLQITNDKRKANKVYRYFNNTMFDDSEIFNMWRKMSFQMYKYSKNRKTTWSFLSRRNRINF